MDIQRHIEDKWGPSILDLAQETATIEVPRSSILDEAAFQQILRRSDVAWLERFCGAPEEQARLALRDCALILAIADAGTRHAKVEAVFRDWISKTRGEMSFAEIPATGGQPIPLQLRWAFMLGIERLEKHLPWLDFYQVGRHISAYASTSAAELENYEPWDEEAGDYESTELPSGARLYGHDSAGELVEYSMYVRLNETGEAMLEWISRMRQLGQLVVEPSTGETVFIAPWFTRSV